MTSDTIELVERVRRHLSTHDRACEIAGPASEAAITAAEEALGCTFPPSYRAFLTTFGGIAIPTHLGVVHDFVGVSARPGGAVAAQTGDAVTDRADVVARTLRARSEHRLGDHLVVVGMGAQYQELFCLDINRATDDGECPILLFDARDNALDQQFYDDFGQMLQEVMGFVADSLEQPLD